MRLVLFLFILLTSQAAMAQTPIPEEQANQFFSACSLTVDPRLTAKNQESMCACNAAYMLEHMSVEDVQTMAQNTPEGRLALNKMLIEVYAPCMNFAVHDLLLTQCLRDPKVKALGANMPVQDICRCTAETTSSWFAKEGREQMREVLKQNPNIYDPIEPVMSTPSFQKQAYENMVACITL